MDLEMELNKLRSQLEVIVRLVKIAADCVDLCGSTSES